MFDTTDFINQPVQEKLPTIVSALKYGFKAYGKHFFRLLLLTLTIVIVGFCYELLCELLATTCGMHADDFALVPNGSLAKFSFLLHPRILFFAWVEIVFATIALQIHDIGTFSFNIFCIPFKTVMRAIGANFLLSVVTMSPFIICKLSYVLLPKMVCWVLLALIILVIGYLFVKSSFYMFFIADGRTTILDSFFDSFTITRSYWWRAAVLLLITRLLFQIYFLILLMPINFLAYAYVYRRLSKRLDNRASGSQFETVL
jgi:hypothetical protein